MKDETEVLVWVVTVDGLMHGVYSAGNAPTIYAKPDQSGDPKIQIIECIVDESPEDRGKRLEVKERRAQYLELRKEFEGS